MEGGAMRGLFTCGVIDVLLENGVCFDGAAGISAGAVFGCNFKSGQIGRALRYNKQYCADPRYCSIRSLIRTGDLYGADFCYRELPDELDVFDRKALRPVRWSSMPERRTRQPGSAFITAVRMAVIWICFGCGRRLPCPWFPGRWRLTGGFT